MILLATPSKIRVPPSTMACVTVNMEAMSWMPVVVAIVEIVISVDNSTMIAKDVLPMVAFFVQETPRVTTRINIKFRES